MWAGWVSLPQSGARWEGLQPALAWGASPPGRPGEAEVAANPARAFREVAGGAAAAAGRAGAAGGVSFRFARSVSWLKNKRRRHLGIRRPASAARGRWLRGGVSLALVYLWIGTSAPSIARRSSRLEDQCVELENVESPRGYEVERDEDRGPAGRTAGAARAADGPGQRAADRADWLGRARHAAVRTGAAGGAARRNAGRGRSGR